SGFLVEQRLDFFRRHVQSLEQVKDNTRIECARSRAHTETVKRGETERTVDALSVFQGTQTRATSQMSDDDAPVGNLRCSLRQDGSDVLVRESMKAVSLQPSLAKVAWKRDEFCNRRLTTMKTGVEAGNLWHTRQSF